MNRFKIAETFPQSKDGISYSELSDKTELQEFQLHRMLRQAIAQRVFTEPAKDSVAQHGCLQDALKALCARTNWLDL